MAENKKSVLLYCDLIHTVEKISDEDAGALFKHYLRYINDLNPTTDNVLVDVLFESIKQNLKRDLVKWEIRAERSRLNGHKGGRPKNPKEPSGLNGNLDKPRKPDTVKVTDTVTVTVNDKEIRELTFREQVAQHTTYEALMLDDFADYWTESNPKGKKLKFELQKTFDIARRLKKWSSNNFNTSKESTMELPTSYPKNSWE
tara:strand:+ start:121 stop:723 length:603 start_codon:yes stop_codon:yes gene_type:complete